LETIYYVYILANSTGTVLYTGVTNDLLRRVYEHKEALTPSFTSKYKLNVLVYFEETDDVSVALGREKQIKGGSRAKKIALIEGMNPEWRDLYDDFF
jgi:putative endonuclease